MAISLLQKACPDQQSVDGMLDLAAGISMPAPHAGASHSSAESQCELEGDGSSISESSEEGQTVSLGTMRQQMDPRCVYMTPPGLQSDQTVAPSLYYSSWIQNWVKGMTFLDAAVEMKAQQAAAYSSPAQQQGVAMPGSTKGHMAVHSSASTSAAAQHGGGAFRDIGNARLAAPSSQQQLHSRFAHPGAQSSWQPAWCGSAAGPQSCLIVSSTLGQPWHPELPAGTLKGGPDQWQHVFHLGTDASLPELSSYRA